MAASLLDDGMIEEIQLVPASKEKRVLNFLFDYIAIIFGVMIFYLFLEGMGYDVETEEDLLVQRLQGMAFYLAYYLLVEGIGAGKTLGKVITKTRVVRLSGAPPEVMDILKRSFIRMVPFEPFSFLGESPSGWHDRWSDTMVIDETLSKIP